MSRTHRAIVFLDDSTDVEADLLLRPGSNLQTGVKNFTERFPKPTTLESDLLLLASTIFASDIAFKREKRENFTRSIEITLPIVNFRAFEPMKEELEYILWVLSRDNWTINFQKAKGNQEQSKKWPTNKGKTLLFSGGLDSLAGAVELLDGTGSDRVLLSSHVTGNQVTRSSQDKLVDYLNDKYEASLEHFVVRSGGREGGGLSFPSDNAREETQRTRSFMYLVIATLAARRLGRNEIVMIAENGQMAIHLPLTAGRVGPFSTHTADPEFVYRIATFLTKLMDYELIIENPFLYKTKAEVVERLVSTHSKAIELSTSCWRNARSPVHCGYCVPCLIRRIALEYNDLRLSEYRRDLFAQDISSLPKEDEGKGNIEEIIEFALNFLHLDDSELETEFSDLINGWVNRSSAIEMYRRFANEVKVVLSRYPRVSEVMGLT